MNYQNISGYTFVGWSTLATADEAIANFANKLLQRGLVVDKSDLLAMTPEHIPYQVVRWEVHRKIAP